MKIEISVIIPCYNNEATIGTCLRAVTQSEFPDFEIIVVDDCSSDRSADIIQDFPCRLIHLPQHRGAGYARNAGAAAARGRILFFTDADCVLNKNTLRIVANSMAALGEAVILGGTYNKQAYDAAFFSCFQSHFIHYAETKRALHPDYIATHAMAMRATLFHHHEGFNNYVYPILEDVEYSHRMKRAGVQLLINPELQVKHIFNFSLSRSLRNAVRKTRYWTSYSLANQDLLTDSGTASHELKCNTFALAATLLLMILFLASGLAVFIAFSVILFFINIFINFRFLAGLFGERKILFGLLASGYYLFIYPLAVGFGAILGLGSYAKNRMILQGAA